MSDVCEAKEVVKKLEPKYAFAKIEGGGGERYCNTAVIQNGIPLTVTNSCYTLPPLHMC